MSLYIDLDEKAVFWVRKKGSLFYYVIIYTSKTRQCDIFNAHKATHHVCKSKNKTLIWEHTFPCFSFSVSLLGPFCQASVSLKAVQSRVQRKEIH